MHECTQIKSVQGSQGKGEVSETKLNSLIAKVTGNDESSDEPGQNEINNLHEDNLKEGKVMTKTMKIEGMMCGHCEATVKKALEAIDGVNSAEVSHEAGTAVVELSEGVQDEVLQKAVEDKDYKVISIA